MVALGLLAGDERVTAVEIPGVFGGVAERVLRPGSVVYVTTEIMEARLVGRDGGIGLLDGVGLRGAEDVASGALPVFAALHCGLGAFVVTALVSVAAVTDEQHSLDAGMCDNGESA